jgi:hypothetical protein
MTHSRHACHSTAPRSCGCVTEAAAALQNEVETYFILTQKSLSIIHFPMYWINMQAAKFPEFMWTDGYQETSWTNTATTSPGWGWGTTAAGKKEPDATSDLCVVADWFESGKAAGKNNVTYKIWMWNNNACTLKRAFICKYTPPRESDHACSHGSGLRECMGACTTAAAACTPCAGVPVCLGLDCRQARASSVTAKHHCF